MDTMNVCIMENNLEEPEKTTEETPTEGEPPADVPSKPKVFEPTVGDDNKVVVTWEEPDETEEDVTVR